MNVTTRYALPLLTAGQAQKEVYHNEALARVDACIGACVTGAALATPPTAPAPGDCYLVAAGATGAWAGQANAIAAFGEGGWRFVAPREGLRLWLVGPDVEAIYRAGAWETGNVRGAKLSVGGTKVVGAQQAAIADPGGGSVVDTQARAALGSVLAALRAHGLIAP